MIKKGVSIFFTIFFMGIMYAPSIIVVLDESLDTSVFYDLSEEEESETESEETKDLEFFSEFRNEVTAYRESSSKEYIQLCFRWYTTPHLSLISPPPELL